MKVKLELVVDNKGILNEWLYDNEEGMSELAIEQIKAYLIQSLFEVCEDWVLHGQEPHIDFEDNEIVIK